MTSSPTILPTAGQVVRRCGWLLSGIDLIHGFRVYTTLVILVDIIRHGSQYLALLSLMNSMFLPTRRRVLFQLLNSNVDPLATCLGAATGLLLIVGNQVLLCRLVRCRLCLAKLLRGNPVEASITAFLFLCVCVSDLAALSAGLKLSQVLHKMDIGTEALEANGRSMNGELRIVGVLVESSLRALLRASLIVNFWYANYRRSMKVLP